MPQDIAPHDYSELRLTADEVREFERDLRAECRAIAEKCFAAGAIFGFLLAVSATCFYLSLKAWP
jgi:hypothetical protein